MSWTFLELICSYPCLHGSSPSIIGMATLTYELSQDNDARWAEAITKLQPRFKFYKIRSKNYCTM